MIELRNNLFEFAAKEWAQDAFISWCFNWFNDSRNPRLKEMSLELLRKFADIEDITSVDVYQQFKKIDVLLIVNDSIAVIIEDKSFGWLDAEQINRYKEELKDYLSSDGSLAITQSVNFEPRERKYDIKKIEPVFFKTGILYPADKSVVEKIGLRVVTGAQLSPILEKYTNDSEIVRDYYEYLRALAKWYQKYEEYYQNGNYEEAFQAGYGQLVCMKDLFQNKEVLIKSSSSRGGKPFTWAWFWESKDGYRMGYRLDSDKKGYYLSLRQYRYYKNEKNKAGIVQEKVIMYENLIERLKELLTEGKYPLKAKLSRNKGKNYESELAKFYFQDNDIVLLKEHLLALGEDLMSAH